MDRPTDELLQRLLAAADGLAEERVARLVDDAAAEAEAEVRDLIKSAMTAAMLRRAVARLEAGSDAAPFEAARPEAEPSPDPVATDAPEPAQPGPHAPDSTAVEREPAEVLPQVPPGAAYVYCIARRVDLDDGILQGMVGVDPAFAPRAVSDESLAAIVSSVSPDTFDAAAIAQRSKDFEWVGQKVRAHDQVIRQTIDAGPVIPLRFGTVLRSEQDVIDLLAAHHEELTAALERLSGKKEWGVKVRVRVSELARSARGADEAAETGSGRTYLLERTRGDRARAEIRTAVRECVQDAHARLAAIAAETSLLPLSRPMVDEGQENKPELVLNGAYLVSDKAVDEFSAAATELAERYAAQGFKFELTGPWPPYNFVGVDLSGGGAA